MQTLIAKAKLLHSSGDRTIYVGADKDECNDAVFDFFKLTSEIPKIHDFTFILVEYWEKSQLVKVETMCNESNGECDEWEGDRFNLMRDPFKGWIT